MNRIRGPLALIALTALAFCGCPSGDQAPARTGRMEQNSAIMPELSQDNEEPPSLISPPEPVPGKLGTDEE